MSPLGIFLAVVAALLLLFFLLTYVCFYLAFCVPKKKPAPTEEYKLPPGKIYEPHRDTMVAWMKETRALPHEDVSITSFDGLTLRGKLYEYAPGAPIELMLHGYRGDAERDLCGGVQRCFALGRSALLVDQRACGHSQGHIITFGINERRDCRAWIDFLIQRMGPEVKILLCGISMGASTVLMTAGQPLPQNVVGVLADCGFTTAPAIIKKVIRQLHLPVWPLYPLVRLGAKLYGRFDLEEYSALQAMQTCRLPVIFFHGETDDFVPCEMSRENFEACQAPKKFVTVPDAGHGLSYLLDRPGYLQALIDFFTANGLPTEIVKK